MVRASGLTVLLVLALAGSAFASGGYVSGASRAAVRAAYEEGGEATNAMHCRRTATSRFVCTYFVRSGGMWSTRAHVKVNFSHGHYYVQEPRYEPPPGYVPVPHVPFSSE